jgi:hypothetical protein
MIFIGDTHGVKAIKARPLAKSDALSTAPTQLSETETSPQSSPKQPSQPQSEMSTIFYQQPSCKPTRVIMITFEKARQVEQMIKSIGFPLKHIETSQVSRGLLGLYFFSLANAIHMYNVFVKVENISDVKYLQDLATFEHCDRVIFDNKFNLTEVNILRFLETVNKVVMIKKLSHQKYLIKFDSICIKENIQKVMRQQFWQFDRRYYESLICFTQVNYDFVFIHMTNPMRLKFCNFEDRNKYKHLSQKIDFKAIIDEQDNRTTIMIKNIPNRIQKMDLVELINKNFYGGYDFIYLPIDFKVKEIFFVDSLISVFLL